MDAIYEWIWYRANNSTRLRSDVIIIKHLLGLKTYELCSVVVYHMIRAWIVVNPMPAKEDVNILTTISVDLVYF